MSRFQTLCVDAAQTGVLGYTVQNNVARGDEPIGMDPSFHWFHLGEVGTFGAHPFRGVKR